MTRGGGRTDGQIIAETKDGVTIRRGDYGALLEQLEDARDVARAREIEARIASGEEECIPIEVAGRLFAGESPVRIWREHRGMSAEALAVAAGIPAISLSAIEAGSESRDAWRTGGDSRARCASSRTISRRPIPTKTEKAGAAGCRPGISTKNGPVVLGRAVDLQLLAGAKGER